MGLKKDQLRGSGRGGWNPKFTNSHDGAPQETTTITVAYVS